MKLFFLAALSCAAVSCSALDRIPAWTDAETALIEMPTFKLVGEYVSRAENNAIQATQLDDGSFLVSTYRGGLPGAGWDASAIKSEKMTPSELDILLKGYEKTNRVSSTIGLKPPEDAVLVFPDDFTNVHDGILMAGGRTTKNLGSFRMHLEFMLPFKPGRNPSSQDRGNSGIYIFNNYELQIIDTFGLDLNEMNNAIPVESHNTQWCGALYKTKVPDLNMTYPPLRWQTYDIDFTAPLFDGDVKTRNARITVRQNGILIQDDIELKTGTGMGATRKQVAEGPVFFQDHKNPVMFRNVWAAAL